MEAVVAGAVVEAEGGEATAAGWVELVGGGVIGALLI